MNSAAATPDPLAGLRGYHLPDAVAWWPPAPGWWLLAVLILALAIGLVLYLLWRRRRGAAARLALEELAGLRSALAEGQGVEVVLRGLSRLLRRFALTRFPRNRVAGLTGKSWMDFLDEHGGHGRFRDGPGRLLAEAPYRPVTELPVEELVDLAEDWIKRNREQTS
jgi:hypothetical protein